LEPLCNYLSLTYEISIIFANHVKETEDEAAAVGGVPLLVPGMVPIQGMQLMHLYEISTLWRRG